MITTPPCPIGWSVLLFLLVIWVLTSFVIAFQQQGVLGAFFTKDPEEELCNVLKKLDRKLFHHLPRPLHSLAVSILLRPSQDHAVEAASLLTNTSFFFPVFGSAPSTTQADGSNSSVAPSVCPLLVVSCSLVVLIESSCVCCCSSFRSVRFRHVPINIQIRTLKLRISNAPESRCVFCALFLVFLVLILSVV